MLYVEQSLEPGEELIHMGEFHWMYVLMAFLAIFWGTLACALFLAGSIYMSWQMGDISRSVGWLGAIPYLHPGLRIFAFLIFVFGLFQFAHMMIVKATTEIAVTNKRLIYKRGLVARHVGEMSVDRIEGVNVLQTILGRLFGYGRIAVRGTGVGEVVLPPIADPILFRKAIQKAQSYGSSKDE